MKDVRRRRLIAAAGTGIAGLGAGCLDGFSTDAESEDSSAGDDAHATPLERWVPAAGPSELLFHYRDLAAVRKHEDALSPSVLEAVPTLPEDELGEHVAAVVDGESAVEAVLRFGSEGTVGNAVVSGTFDPDALEGSESAVGEFETVEHEEASVAVSAETVVLSTADGPALDAILAAGVEGDGRRADAAENFARLSDRLGDATFAWGEYADDGEDDAAGNGSAVSWTLGPETTDYSLVAVYADAEGTDEFADVLGADSDNMTIEIDGNVGVATESIPTGDYEYRDPFAERGSRSTQPMAGVTFDIDRSAETVTVSYVSSENTDRLEVQVDGTVREVLTEVGEAATLEVDGEGRTEIAVVAVNEESEVVVAREAYEF